MTTYKHDVFLSHNSQDKPAVKWLAIKLEDEAKIKVFLDIWNLIPGDPWQEDLENALDASRTVAVFLGPAGISGWHNEELRDAINTRVRDPERRVVPVLLPGTTMPQDDEIPNFLQRLTWVDFRAGLDDEDAFCRLVAGIRGQAPGRNGNAEPKRPPPQLAEVPKNIEEEKNMDESKINTDGGAYIGGSVNTNGGDFVGRDKTVTAERGGVVIGGNVTGSNIVTGDNNVITTTTTITLQKQYIQQIFADIDKDPALTQDDKEDLKSEVTELQKEDENGQRADETRVSRHLRNIKRMAPDILDVVLGMIANPVAGFGMVAKKVAEKMKTEAG
jgi:hypothetical protein